jgi:hypothetical protein
LNESTLRTYSLFRSGIGGDPHVLPGALEEPPPWLVSSFSALLRHGRRAPFLRLDEPRRLESAGRPRRRSPTTPGEDPSELFQLSPPSVPCGAAFVASGNDGQGLRP